jgi:hypothetical protein
MSLRCRHVAPLLVAAGAAAAMGAVPVAGADPQAGTESARATIDDLTAEGYNVEINWVGRRSTESLSRCSVSAIHNPDASPPPPKTFTTVYVDVSCPDEHDDSGFIFGTFGIFG